MNEAIITIARETGWTLDYIRSLPIDYIKTILNEIVFQKALEAYQAIYNSAIIVCALVSSDERHYAPEDIIGECPERRVMAEPNLAQTPKITSIVLADGKEYQLAPLTANMIADIEEKFDKSTEELFRSNVRMRSVIALYFARIRPKYPDMTEQKLGDLITDDVLINMKDKLGI